MEKESRDGRALRRRMAILALLHTRPRSYAQLQAALADQRLLDEEDLFGPSYARHLRDQFRADCRVFRTTGFEVYCDRRSGLYHWRNSSFGFSLDESQLFALGVLRAAFADERMLHHGEITGLLDHLVALLPADQQATLAARRPFAIDLRQSTDYRSADPATVALIERAIAAGQQLELCYVSPREGVQRRHTVEPTALILKAGHVYLPVYNVEMHKYFELRLDRIVPGSAKILPRRAMHTRPAPPEYLLRYRLSPAIARHSVSENFPNQQVEHDAEGYATVTARTTDLFDARRKLLAYGSECVVLDPPELVAELRRMVEALHKVYVSKEE